MPSGGGGFEFGVDPNEDPELALALRVSMEEQRARQQVIQINGGALCLRHWGRELPTERCEQTNRTL